MPERAQSYETTEDERRSLEQLIAAQRVAQAAGALDRAAVAREGLAWIERKSGGDFGGPYLIWDPWILELLQPLARHPALRVLCSCGVLITKASYDGDGGIMLGHWARTKLPDGAVQLIAKPSHNVIIDHSPTPALIGEASNYLPQSSRRAPSPVQPYSQDGMWRRRLICPKPVCAKTYVFTPVGMLGAWLRAVADGREVLGLSDVPLGRSGALRQRIEPGIGSSS